MPILAGIDEAGYGPTLGPLVVSAAAFETPDERDLWDALAEGVTRARRRNDPRLVVADSKKVYASGRGMAQLERTVLAFASALGGTCAGPAELIQRVAPNASADEQACLWYAPADGSPLAAAPEAVAAGAELLRGALRRAGVRIVLLASRVMFAPQFNAGVRRYGNKAAVSFGACADLLARLLERGDAFAYVDKQGGRSHYAAVLQDAFPLRRIRVVEEGPRCSRYEIEGERGALKVEFAQGCEDRRLPTALASMLSKYVREAYMRRFNSFWSRRAPHAKPTAGYPQDARRFLAETADARRRLGIEDEDFIRMR